MLPRLLDTTGFQSATNMTADEFATAAMSGMVPRAIGALANVPLWPEHIVETFCREVGRTFNSEWTNANGHAVPSLATATLANAVAVAAPSAREAMEWPDEMTQSMAARYCEC